MAGTKIDRKMFRVLDVVAKGWIAGTIVLLLILSTYCILSPVDLDDYRPDNIERNLFNLWFVWGLLPSFILGALRFLPYWDVDDWKGTRK